MKIPIVYASQQAWWQNFWDRNPIHYSELSQLQKALKPYNCRYINDMWPGTPYIEFDKEQDYVMFVLRWS